MLLSPHPTKCDALPNALAMSPALKIKWLNLIAAMTCATALSCDLPFDEEPVSRHFLIRQGEHYSTPRLMETMDSRTIKFKATFDESARYTLDDASMQTNKNKLMGFSDCSSLHHENSARFGWQWFNDQLEIYAYCYVDSVRIEEFLQAIDINEENLYEITKTDGQYIFYINGDRKTAISRSHDCKSGVSYVLYPYFGGSVPAPHDVRIKIWMIQ